MTRIYRRCRRQPLDLPMAWRGHNSAASWRHRDVQSLLRLKEVSPSNQIGGHRVSKPVEAGSMHPRMENRVRCRFRGGSILSIPVRLGP